LGTTKTANQRKIMNTETTESFYNAHARKVARWDKEQALHDAAAAGSRWVFPTRSEMQAKPRETGESLSAYAIRLKEVAK